MEAHPGRFWGRPPARAEAQWPPISTLAFQDSRPDGKTQIAFANSLRYFFIEADGALQSDYRYYRDDFGVRSHTLDLSWFQNVTRSLKIVPMLRYYSQTAADFYTNIEPSTLWPTALII